jgi:hypothetical protein
MYKYLFEVLLPGGPDFLLYLQTSKSQRSGPSSPCGIDLGKTRGRLHPIVSFTSRFLALFICPGIDRRLREAFLVQFHKKQGIALAPGMGDRL